MDENNEKDFYEVTDTSSASASSEKVGDSGSVKSKIIWSLLFVLIAVMTVSAIMSQGDFSFSEFLGFLAKLHPGWLIAAIACMFGIIFFEGFAILTIARSFGYKRNPLHGYIYAAGDIYFSAITPSASGGQPASAYFMMKDGIPGPMVTMTLVVNLILYTFAILIFGVIAFILSPSLFLGFSLFGKLLIIVGCLALCFIAFCFIIILVKSSILYRLCDWGLNLLFKLRLIRKLDRKKAKLRAAIDSYACHVSQLGGKRAMLIKALLFNMLQRFCTMAVTLCVFFASGGDLSMGVDVWVSQCMVILGSNTVPIPGAMGVSDFLLIDAFGGLGYAEGVAMNLNLLSRAISFYGCVAICGISMIIRMISYKLISSRNSRLSVK